MSSTDPKTMSTRRKTALAIIDLYESWNIDNIMSLRTDDCIHLIIPEILGHKPYNNEAYRKMFAHAMARVWNFKVTVLDVIEDPVANKVVVFASSKADSKAGEGTYGQTYVLSFEFNEPGTKITKMVEFVDSAKARKQAAILWGNS